MVMIIVEVDNHSSDDIMEEFLRVNRLTSSNGGRFITLQSLPVIPLGMSIQVGAPSFTLVGCGLMMLIMMTRERVIMMIRERNNY
jgi:hypothetical protein